MLTACRYINSGRHVLFPGNSHKMSKWTYLTFDLLKKNRCKFKGKTVNGLLTSLIELVMLTGKFFSSVRFGNITENELFFILFHPEISFTCSASSYSLTLFWHLRELCREALTQIVVCKTGLQLPNKFNLYHFIVLNKSCLLIY